MSNNYRKLQDMGQNRLFKDFKNSNVVENFVHPHQYRVNDIPKFPIKEPYQNDHGHGHGHVHHFPVKEQYENVHTHTNVQDDNKNIEFKQENSNRHNLEMNIESAYGVVSSPDIFGPSYWFTLHAGSIAYPINPTPIVREKMKNFIIGIPVMIPCKNCQEHATAYIEKYYDKLNNVCSSRDSLFKFFVDFHNAVNQRKGKSILSYDDAYKLYTGKVKINKITYS